MAAPTPLFAGCTSTSTRGSSTERARSTVSSVEASSTTKMRSTNPGMPCRVAAIKPSSLCAGTTTATLLPSSMRRWYGERRLGGTWTAGVHDDRHDRAEDQSDQRTDEKRAAARVRRRLHRARRDDDLRALDLRCERELLLQRLLLGDQVAEPRLGVVLLADDHELLERIEVPRRALRLGDDRKSLVHGLDLVVHLLEGRLERPDLQADVRGGRARYDELRQRVRGRLRRGRAPTVDGRP